MLKKPWKSYSKRQQSRIRMNLKRGSHSLNENNTQTGKYRLFQPKKITLKVLSFFY